MYFVVYQIHLRGSCAEVSVSKSSMFSSNGQLGWIRNAFQFHDEDCLSYFAGKELHIKTYGCYMHIVIVVIIVFTSAIVMLLITVTVISVINLLLTLLSSLSCQIHILLHCLT